MADAYYDYNNGLVGNDGLTPSTPKATRAQAVGVSAAGDKVIAMDGIHGHESGQFLFDDDRIESSNTFQGATLQANTSETLYAARTSGNLLAANNPFKAENLVIDCSTANGGAGATQSFFIVRDITEDLTIQLHSMHIKEGNLYGLFVDHRRGRIELVNIKITATPSTGMLGSTSNLSGDGNLVFDINGLELNGTITSGLLTGVSLIKANNLTNTFDLKVKGLTGTLNTSGTGSVIAANIKSIDPNISNFNFTINNTGTGTGDFGILVQGQSVAVCTNPVVSNGIVNYNSPVGYAVAIGQSVTDANVTGGEVSGVKVIGKYYSLATPHGFLIGQGVAGATLIGSTATDIFVGYIASKCTSATLEGNLAFDCYGPSYYVKGTTAVIVQDNIAVVTSKYVQRTQGVLAVVAQGVTNTVSATVRRNLVIVQDLTNIHSLAQIGDVNQVCTFSNNSYIVPSEQYVEGNNYFDYENGTANNTLAQWNAQAEVTDDVIIPMPASEIAAKIKGIKEGINQTPKLMMIPSRGLVSTIGSLVIN